MRTPAEVARAAVAAWITEDGPHLDHLERRVADAVRADREALRQELLAHGLAGCPVTRERVGEVASLLTRYAELGKDPDAPLSEVGGKADELISSLPELFGFIYWQAAVIAFLANGPEGDDLRKLLADARREGFNEAKAKCIEAAREGLKSSWYWSDILKYIEKVGDL